MLNSLEQNVIKINYERSHNSKTKKVVNKCKINTFRHCKNKQFITVQHWSAGMTIRKLSKNYSVIKLLNVTIPLHNTFNKGY